MAGTSTDDVAEVMLAADFFPQVGVLGLEPNLLLLQQHTVCDIDEHRARVLAVGAGLDHHWTQIGLPLSLRRNSSTTPLVSVPRSIDVSTSRRRLGRRGIGHQRLPERLGDLFWLDAQNSHRSAVDLDKAGIKAFLHVGDRGFVEKITEVLLALDQTLRPPRAVSRTYCAPPVPGRRLSSPPTAVPSGP